MKNLSDEELVEKVRKEDSKLYAEIVKRYQQKLYRYLRYLIDYSSRIMVTPKLKLEELGDTPILGRVY
jgi:hypothetical protein